MAGHKETNLGRRTVSTISLKSEDGESGKFPITLHAESSYYIGIGSCKCFYPQMLFVGVLKYRLVKYCLKTKAIYMLFECKLHELYDMTCMT